MSATARPAADDHNTVTIIGKHIEFGQGSYTGLATILAEELEEVADENPPGQS